MSDNWDSTVVNLKGVDPYKEKQKKIQATGMKLLRKTEGKTRRNRIRSEIYRREVGIQDLLIS
jgi:hypothetical protein